MSTQPLPAETTAAVPDEGSSQDFNPEERALCPDDACIGVLDHSGRCKECGRQGQPAVAASGERTDVAPAEPDGAASGIAATAAAFSAAEADELGESEDDDGGAADEFSDRQLCSDPSCIGVLDAGGRCKECGRSSGSSAPA